MEWLCEVNNLPLLRPMPTKQPPSLKARAIAALARREHSRQSLLRKLSSPDQDPTDLHLVLDELESLGLLSDQRFAEAWVRHRGGRLGAARLRQELMEQGVAESLIEPALQASELSEAMRAYLVWQKRFGQPPASAEDRARQQRFLAQRGFGFDAFRAIERRGFEPPDEVGADSPLP